MQQNLRALKSFTHSAGTVEKDTVFEAPVAFAKSLVENGFAQLASINQALTGPWLDCTTIIMASGSSLTAEDIEAVRLWRGKGENRRVIVVCRTYEKALWADVIYAADDNFWERYYSDIAEKFQGQCWSQSELARRKFGTNYISCERRPGLSRLKGVIHNGGNSGYQAVGLAYEFGSNRIILLGFDMKLGKKKYHHDPYPAGFPQVSPFENWCANFTTLAYELRQQRVRVINATPLSALQCFERMSLDEALLKVDQIEQRAVRVPTFGYCLLSDSSHYRKGIFEAGMREIGCKVRPGEPSRFDDEILVVIWNRYGRHHDLATKIEASGGTVIVVENGYIAKGGGTPKYDGGYYAIALGGHNGNGTWRIGGSERLDALQLQFESWKESGYVLICPNRSFGQPGTIMPETWATQTRRAIEKTIDREIKVRPHPGKSPPAIPLKKDLEGASACVIWSSSCGIHSLLAGVPVVRMAPRWVASECSSQDLGSLVKNDEARRRALQAVAWAQWDADEIATGKAFKHLLGVESCG